MPKILKNFERYDGEYDSVNDAICIRCGRCVKVCRRRFSFRKAGAAVTLHKPENCIVCGHCAAACLTGAVEHADFPAEGASDHYAALPTEQVELLLAVRRTALFPASRAAGVSGRIVAAADRADDQRRQLGYTLVTDPYAARNRRYTLGVFGGSWRLSNPLVRPWLSRLLPGVYRYIPAFRRMRLNMRSRASTAFCGCDGCAVSMRPRAASAPRTRTSLIRTPR
ncbi:MAG: ferredoxin family protein [Alistipes finegoldii]